MNALVLAVCLLGATDVNPLSKDGDVFKPGVWKTFTRRRR